MKKTTVSLTVICALICSISFAQTSTSSSNSSTTSGTTSTSGAADTVTTNFIANATLANMKEIAAGKLAERKAKDPAVKAYGRKMVEDHTKATKEMMAIVKSKGYNVPTPAAEAAAPDSMLTSAKGADFDKNYVTMMVMDHQKTVQLFQTASTNVTDPDIKGFAVKTLPILQQHLTMIQSIASKMNISAQ